MTSTTLTGSALALAVQSPPPTPPALIDHFLYENCCLLLTGETGKGKSVIAAQMALSLSSGTPLFSSLPIPIPRRVYYMQLEGSFPEQLRRLHFMSSVIPLNAANLYWDADRLTPPLQRYDRIATAFVQPPEVVILDPIYKATGDLAKAEYAMEVVRFSDRLMASFGCAVILLHHPHRDKLNPQGKVIAESDSYYGHSFLKNHVETSYVFKPMDTEGATGQLLRRKRREENTLALLDLVYHPETYTCSMLPQMATSSKRDAVLRFLQSRTGRTTSFAEVKSSVGLSTQFLRELQVEYEARGTLKVIREPGKQSVWVPMFETTQEVSHEVAGATLSKLS